MFSIIHVVLNDILTIKRCEYNQIVMGLWQRTSVEIPMKNRFYEVVQARCALGDILRMVLEGQLPGSESESLQFVLLYRYSV